MGKAIVLGDNINGDQIIAGSRLSGKSEADGVPYLFESVRSDFAKIYEPGDVVVAGDNFGCGSSREVIIQVIKAAGIKYVIAKSFARQFYRAGINNGIAPIECAGEIHDGEPVEVDLEHNTVKAGDKVYTFTPFPKQVIGFINEGGVLNYYMNHHSLN